MRGGRGERAELLRSVSYFLNKNQGCKIPDIVAYTGASRSNIHLQLTLLKRAGFVRSETVNARGLGRGYPTARYYTIKPIPSDITATTLKELIGAEANALPQPEEKPTIIPGHSIIVLRLLAKDKNGAFAIEEPYDKLFLTEVLDGCPDHVKVIQRLEVRPATTDDVFNRMDFLGGNSVTR